MLEAMAGIVFVAAFVAAVVSWFVAAVSMFRMVANRKEGVPLFPAWYESPVNLVFRPRNLTDRGLSARRWLFYGFIGFIACLLLCVIAGSLAGLE
jgi:hypothetical protein